jgi:uncharacterized protein (TIGR01370 family)
MKGLILRLTAGLTAALFPTPAPAEPLTGVTSWAAYYGSDAPTSSLAWPDLLVLEPDHPWQLSSFRRPGQRVLAYLSMGEVHKTRPYFVRLNNAKALLGKNPDWPDAQRVDPAAPAWRKLLLETLAPELLARGYDGFFLDTLDAAGELERTKKRPGARKAMTSLVQALHDRFPKATIVANGGMELLPEIAPAIAGMAVESIFTAYQFKPAKYAWRAEPEAQARKLELQALSARYHFPILGLEYADEPAMRAKAHQLLVDAGFVPSVAEIGLNQPPSRPDLGATP